MTSLRPPAPAIELYELLQAIDWSNTRLAKELGVAPNTVSRWLHRHNSPPVYVLRMLRRRAAAKKRTGGT